MSPSRRVLLLLAIVLVLLDLTWVMTKPLDEDEVEHLHAAYLVSQGDRPYVDFWQSHPPLFWEMFAPVLRVFPESAGIGYVARGYSMAIAVLLFLVLWRWIAPGSTVHGPRGRGRWVMPLLIFATIAIPAQLFYFRPDCTVLLAGLTSLLLTARALEPGGKNGSRTDGSRALRFGPRLHFAAGCLMGLALAGSPKILPLAGSAPALLLWYWIETRRPRGSTGTERRAAPFADVGDIRRALLLYVLGGIAGFAILVIYLFARGVANGYWKWIVEYQGGRGMSLAFDSVWVPTLLAGSLSLVVLALLRAWKTPRPVGAAAADIRERDARDEQGARIGEFRGGDDLPSSVVPRYRLLLVATVLMLLGSIALYPITIDVMAFYLAPLLVLVSGWGVFLDPASGEAATADAAGSGADGKAQSVGATSHDTQVARHDRGSLHANRTGPRKTAPFMKSVAVVLAFSIVVAATAASVRNDVRSIADGGTLKKYLTFIDWMIDVSAHGRVLCHVPQHPIYARDATDFWVRWQYHHLLGKPSQKQDMLRDLLRRQPPFDDALRANPPQLIHAPSFARHLDLLRKERLLTVRQFENAHTFVEANYNLVRGVLFVRKDISPN